MDQFVISESVAVDNVIVPVLYSDVSLSQTFAKASVRIYFIGKLF